MIADFYAFNLFKKQKNPIFIITSFINNITIKINQKQIKRKKEVV